ncbi:MAG TPA: hypothetical protein PLV68_04160, partial [Ilumatobacteraceae bacterium]|nr:hypothetical protein [Ilumatobacteraceae bacterium]
KVEFAHPVSVREQRPVSIAFMTLWLGSMLWLALAERVIQPLRIILVLAPMWTVFQVVRRAVQRRNGTTLRPAG